MRLLFTGKGSSGSWQIRGEQLGAELGATVKPNATLADCSAADLIVCVKRTPAPVVEAIRACGRPWLLDLVDCWPQPTGNRWHKDEAIRFLRERLRTLRPTGAIYATMAMQDDADYPGFTLPHHGRSGLGANPIRENVATVAYEGRDAYLGPWRKHIERECARRDWKFVVNPPRITDADIVVAFRGGEWDGYACWRWKSNVKLANCQITGTPFVGLPESGYTETASGAEYFVWSAPALALAFDWLTPHENRLAVGNRLRSNAYTVADAAKDFRCGARSFLTLT